MFCVIFVLHLSQLIPSIFHMYKLFGEFLESKYKYTHLLTCCQHTRQQAQNRHCAWQTVLVNMVPIPVALETDAPHQLEHTSAPTKTQEFDQRKLEIQKKKPKQNKCLPSQRLLQLYLSMLLFTSAPSFLHLALLLLLIIS